MFLFATNIEIIITASHTESIREDGGENAGVYNADVTSIFDDKGSGIEAKALNHRYYYTSTEVINDVIGITGVKESGFSEQ